MDQQWSQGSKEEDKARAESQPCLDHSTLRQRTTSQSLRCFEADENIVYSTQTSPSKQAHNSPSGLITATSEIPMAHEAGASQGCPDSNDRQSRSLPRLGVSQRAKESLWIDIGMILIVLICFVTALITIGLAPGCQAIPWKLRVTKQFQILGVLLNLMYQVSKPIISKLFLLVEAKFQSYLQNYDAILRNSFVQAKTQPAWRATLLTLMVIPFALSVAYKNFDHGIGRSDMHSAGNDYGLIPPSGLDASKAGSIGLSLMANSTTPFISATAKQPELPSFPQAYGFNVVLLSNTSSARLDLPSSPYLQELQGRLPVDEAYILTAEVQGIVTSYNDSIETDRNDDDFWNYYLGMTCGGVGECVPGNQTDQDVMILDAVHSMPMFNGYYLDLLMNDLGIRNTSWLFFNFNARGGPAITDVNAFRASAMLFQTRRESCKGTWRITYNSLQLMDGKCDGPPLSEKAQTLLTSATLAFPTFYLPSLCEYLQAFSDTPKRSIWKVPTFATVIAGMYWSRLAMFDSFYDTQEDMTTRAPAAVYHVQDHLISERPVMNVSPWLIVLLAVYPVLVTLAFVAYLILRPHVSFDAAGFGTTALLAGVKPETLPILDGASMSGKLKRRVRVKFLTNDSLLFEEDEGGQKTVQEIKYILAAD